MNMPRFYVSPLARSGELSTDQAHHARDVLRLNADTAVVLFDGDGQWASAQLTIQKKQVTYQLTTAMVCDPLPLHQLTIAAAVPQGYRVHDLVEKISQLGVDQLIWLECRYSVVHPSAAADKMDKWKRLAIESAKQCGRNRILAVAPPCTLMELLDRPDINRSLIWTDVKAAQSLLERLMSWQANHARNSMPAADPNERVNFGPPGNAAAEPLDHLAAVPEIYPASGLTILIGPEGGWSREEQARLNHMAPPVRLGNHILRIETAAAAAAAITQAAMALLQTHA
ncbi:MAG: RsmE family RNA methyltransferase [Phycisphaerae bacterium]